MKTKLTIMFSSILAATAMTLGVTAEPASAMPRSCLSLHLAWQQAVLDANLAFNTMLTFEENAHQYFTPYYESMYKGWYEDFTGQIQYYDESEARWHQDDAGYQLAADLMDADADTAYADYLDTCGWS
jgi:hypothetical protein